MKKNYGIHLIISTTKQSHGCWILWKMYCKEATHFYNKWEGATSVCLEHKHWTSEVG
jgi:hypothetical protein